MINTFCFSSFLCSANIFDVLKIFQNHKVKFVKNVYFQKYNNCKLIYYYVNEQFLEFKTLKDRMRSAIKTNFFMVTVKCVVFNIFHTNQCAKWKLERIKIWTQHPALNPISFTTEIQQMFFMFPNSKKSFSQYSQFQKKIKIPFCFFF